MTTLKATIIALAAAITIFACNDEIFYQEPLSEPVKAIDIVARKDLIHPLPDGSLAIAVQDQDGTVAVARIRRDGTIVMSDSIHELSNFHNLIVNNLGECLFSQQNIIEDTTQLYKLDRMGKLSDYKKESYYVNKVQVDKQFILLDNGEIAYFYREENTNTEEYTLTMHIVGNNFTYVMEKDIDCDDAYSFGDKIFVANAFSSEYCIFNLDGSLIADGDLVIDECSMNYFSFAKYLGGYLYVVSYGRIKTSDPEDVTYNYFVTKMDTLGNRVFSTKIDDAYQIQFYMTLNNDLLILTGVQDNDSGKTGQIYLIDNNSGLLTETISLNYGGSESMPLFVSPDGNGEYDVFVGRNNVYDEEFGNDYYTKLFIYHVDDLYKLQMTN